MHYSEFKNRIERMAVSAPADARYRFVIDSIRRMAESSADAVESEMSPPEQVLMSGLLGGLEDRSPDQLTSALTALTDSMSKDPVSGIESTRGIEFRPDLVQLLDAIDRYVQYRQTGDPSFVAAVAINMVNSLDYHSDEDGDYPSEDILASPAMASEFARVQRLLAYGS